QDLSSDLQRSNDLPMPVILPAQVQAKFVVVIVAPTAPLDAGRDPIAVHVCILDIKHIDRHSVPLGQISVPSVLAESNRTKPGLRYLQPPRPFPLPILPRPCGLNLSGCENGGEWSSDFLDDLDCSTILEIKHLTQRRSLRFPQQKFQEFLHLGQDNYLQEALSFQLNFLIFLS